MCPDFFSWSPCLEVEFWNRSVSGSDFRKQSSLGLGFETRVSASLRVSDFTCLATISLLLPCVCIKRKSFSLMRLVHTGNVSLQHFTNKFFCFIFHVCTCRDFVPATFPRDMSLLHVPYLWTTHDHDDFVAATCPCDMFVRHDPSCAGSLKAFRALFFNSIKGWISCWERYLLDSVDRSWQNKLRFTLYSDYFRWTVSI